MAITQAPAVHDEDGDSQSHQHAQPGPVQPPPVLHQHQHSLSNASTVTVDIESWTVAALESLRIAPIARGTGNALSIPLDDAHHQHAEVRDAAAAGAGMKLRGVAFNPADPYGAAIAPPRDSMRKRDALVKGKEGSRQRRRWENDHLLHVPNVVPPLPSDWQIHPTHRVLPTVPYQLAQYWDKGLRERVEAQKQKQQQQQQQRQRKKKQGLRSSSNNNSNNNTSAVDDDTVVGHVPRDLRNTAKRTPAVKSWLRVLEEPVRAFVVERGLASAGSERAAGSSGESSSSSDETDSDDEEIVFVGRNGRMRDGKPWKPARRQVVGQGQGQQAQGQQAQGEGERGLVLELEMEEAEAGGGGGGGGAFKRWLTHSISDYYGLDSKSVMVGTPARRVVYVGVKRTQAQMQAAAAARHNLPSRPVLPPPLWEMF